MGLEYIVTCISSRRPDNVQKTFDVVGSDGVLFVVNDEEDVKNYKANGAEYVIIGGSLTKNRNAALDFCFKNNKICVQIDDDLKKITSNNFDGKRTGEKVNLMQALEVLMPKFIKSDYNFAGAPPTDNPYFAQKPFSENLLITAPFTMTKPNPIRFDNNLTLKEDYDYTLQHIASGLGVIRYSDFLFSFGSNVGSGGCVDYRTSEREQENIAKIFEKWGDAVYLNKKREDQICIRRNVFNILNK